MSPIDDERAVMQDPAISSDTGAVPQHGVGTDAPVIPGYRFRKRLGRGGMATVYLATQESLDRPVSIKVMESGALTDEVARQRFENEARTIARLSHPNIVAIHEVGRAGDGRPYYVMPYLGSGDLSQRDFTADEPRAIEVLRALLSALGYAHARGIVHRDVKRENVLFDADERPMLADFGIALSRGDDIRLTSAGLAVGSSGTMAPEQARGEVVDGRADLYSVGVLAFEMLTGRLPYEANDALALAIMHAQDPIPRLPPDKRHWQTFIDRAMAKSREARYQNAQEMQLALGRAAQRPSGLTGQVLQVVKSTGEGRWKRPAAVLVGVALLAAIVWFARERGSTPLAVSTPAGAVLASMASANPPAASGVAQPTASSSTPDDAATTSGPTSAAADASSASGDAVSPASSDASAASDAPSSQASSSAAKPRRAHHAAPQRARPKRRNFISRWWHSL